MRSHIIKLISLRNQHIELKAKQFWVFFETIEILDFCPKTLKTVLLISQQPNTTGRLVFKTTSYKDHSCSFLRTE